MPNTPFELEAAIAAWRDTSSARDELRTSDLAELESHLRDAWQDLRSRGLTEEEAFFVAQRRLGSEELTRELAQVHPDAVWARRGYWMLAGVLGYHVLKAVFSVGDSLITALAVWMTRDVTTIRWVQIGTAGVSLGIFAWVLLAVVRGRLRAPSGVLLRPLNHPLSLVPLVVGLFVGERLLATASTILQVRVMSIEQYGTIAVSTRTIDLIVLLVSAVLVGTAMAMARRRKAVWHRVPQRG